MTKNPLEILTKEHKQVLKLLDELENNINKKDISKAGKTIAILEREFNKHSLNKEEKVLFPEIEKFLPRDGGPTGVMITEHEDLVNSIKNAKDGVKTKNVNKVSENGSHIISVLRQHIDKEDNMLFMMAEMHLDDKQKSAIIKKFLVIDSKK